ncbi:MAG: glycosyltransferase family 2 protein [Streptococcaceae bacterium]|nr:glycosyltransferase family 2 protein [Streptococcaceae bacterium]
MKEINKIHTFVICAYKESPYLENCILSLISQKSVLKGQSMVVLYTSTPNNFITSLCEKYEIEQFTGQGGSIGADWNSSLSFVETKYATIAHQDDIYRSSYGSEVLQMFIDDSELNIAFSDYYEIDEYEEIRIRNTNLKVKTFALKLMNLWKNKHYQRRIYAFGNFICCPAVSYNMERLKKFKFNEQMKMVLDWDMWERIMKFSGTIAYTSKRLMAHRIHNESETTNNTVDKNREKEEYQMFRRYWGRGMSSFLMKFYVKNQKNNIK